MEEKINDNDPYVIAEIGHNHQGNLKLALKMIAAAAASGVNAVKLQKEIIKFCTQKNSLILYIILKIVMAVLTENIEKS